VTLETGSPVRGDDTPVGIIRPRAVGRRRGRWGAGRVVVVGLLLVLGLVVGYYLISLYQVWSTGRSDGARPVDAIVVMGAAQYDGEPSPVLAARLDHVVDLWPEGLAPLIVVTGGNQPGDRFTEAEASAAYLVERGVPADAIVQEADGGDTFESLQGGSELLAERGLDEVLIVTDPYHSLRSRIIAEDLGLDAWVSPTPYSVVDGGESFQRHLQEAAGVALGRIIGFDDL
jgi:uncharacterized SAM-binding protein YcdF (DUF218 family)